VILGLLPLAPLASISDVLDPLERVMRSILDFLHTSIGLPWSWSIVALTLLVRIVLVPLTVRQIHSMQALQAHAPQMKEIQKKYKGDRQKLNEELMKFYKENNINPAASCLPMVAQLPVFFALYLTLKHSTKCAANAKDCIDGSWLHVVPNISDKASAHWSGWVLLAVYAGSQIASTYFMGTTMDKTQRRIMMVLPLAFLTVISRFPMGLTLYWMTTNLWTVGQGLVTRRLVPRTPAPAASSGGGRSSRTPPKSGDGPGASNGKAEPTPKQQPAKRQQQPRTQRRKRGGARR
jgi:YidC/Oxa1 family membrane protein insertase